jgi:sugar lactone lactonase YvrE
MLLVGFGAAFALGCSEDRPDDGGPAGSSDGGDAAVALDGGPGTDSGGADGSSPADFPVEAIELVTGVFAKTEGIAFNSEGRLFVGSLPTDEDPAHGIHEIQVDGTATVVNDEVKPVGFAPAPDGDIYACDMGPLVSPDDALDGTVVRVSPDGTSVVWGTGMPDPNFVTVRADGALLVSDDFGDEIYLVPAGGGEATVWYEGIESPNGMAFSLDSRQLFVAQTFMLGDPPGLDNRVWVIPVDEQGDPAGEPELLATLDENAANDGVVVDENGLLYIAANTAGKIFRVDPADGSTEVVAEDMVGVASFAFGKGDFNRTSIYATHLFEGTVWEVPVGVGGAPLH